MVLGFGGLVIFFWKLMLPLKEALTVSGRAFLRFWPALIVIPMLLLGYALWLRVGAYGLTPERYFLAAFGLLMFVFAAMQAVPYLRNWVPGAAPLTVIALILGSFGPWGAEAVSIKSQVRHFAGLLDEQAQVIAGEGARASSILRFLTRHEALDELKTVAGKLNDDPFTPETNESKYTLQARLEKAFGVAAATTVAAGRNGHRTFQFEPGLVTVEGYDLHFADVQLYIRNRGFTETRLGNGLVFKFARGQAVIAKGETETVFSLQPFMTFAQDNAARPPAQGIELRADGKVILIVPRYLQMRLGDQPQFIGGNGALFLRSRDWQ